MKSRSKLRLGDACEKIGSGATPRGGKNAYQGGRFALVRSQNVYNHGFEHDGLVYINDEQAKALANVELRTNDVLINITGDSVARCCQIDPGVLPARVNQHVAIIRPDQRKLDARFLRYKLISPEMQHFLLAIASAGGTRNSLTKAFLENLEIDAPPLSEQCAIARILGSLDDKIELNRQMNRTLEAMARALFKSWFIDFDPVHANAAGTPTLPADLATLFPAKFQPSDLGDVPKGWQITRLDSLLMLHYGKALPKTKRRPGSVPVYGSGGITGEHDTSLVCGPGIIVGRKGSVGTLYWEDQDFFPIDTTFYVEPSPSVSLHYLMNLLETLGLKAMNTDAAVPGLNRENVYRLTVAKPPEPLIERFHHLVAGLRTRIESNARESRTLAALRDSLLPKLLSGELSVGDASEVAA